VFGVFAFIVKHLPTTATYRSDFSGLTVVSSFSTMKRFESFLGKRLWDGRESWDDTIEIRGDHKVKLLGGD
jgi:hypothetical protein